MKQRATVEVFVRRDKEFLLVVEPPIAIAGVRRHLESQKGEVEVSIPFVAGDLAVNLLNGKTLDQVLGDNALIAAWHTDPQPAITETRL